MTKFRALAVLPKLALNLLREARLASDLLTRPGWL